MATEQRDQPNDGISHAHNAADAQPPPEEPDTRVEGFASAHALRPPQASIHVFPAPDVLF